MLTELLNEPSKKSIFRKFQPQSDITVQELARIIELLELSMTVEMIEKLPENFQKHFSSQMRMMKIPGVTPNNGTENQAEKTSDGSYK